MAPTVFLGSLRNCRQPWGAPSCHPQRPAPFGHTVELSPSVMVEVDGPERQAEDESPLPTLCVSDSSPGAWLPDR